MRARTGQGLVEYSMIILLIAIGVFAALLALAPALQALYERVGASLAG